MIMRTCTCHARERHRVPFTLGLPGGFVSSRVVEAILIHRDGTFLARCPLVARDAKDWAAHARALLELMETVNTSFGSASNELRELTFGDTTLRIEVSPHLVLAVVVRGRVRPGLVRRLRAALDDVEFDYHAALAGWTGRPEALAGVGAFLQRLVGGA